MTDDNDRRQTEAAAVGVCYPIGLELLEYRDTKGRLIHPDAESVFACGNCDSACPRYRTRGNESYDADKPIFCDSCGQGSGVDEVVERGDRGPHSGGSTTGGLSEIGMAALKHGRGEEA